MKTPKYTNGIQVRVVNPGAIYADWREKERKLGIPDYSNYRRFPNFKDFVYTVEADDKNSEGVVIYHISSKEGCHILIEEGGIDENRVIGHQYIGEVCPMKEGELYDVEEWTPVAGGNFIGLQAIKVTKSEAEVFIKKNKELHDKWVMQPSGFRWPWCNGIRVVPHVPRIYLPAGHESKCPSGVYDLKNWDNKIEIYKILHYAAKDFGGDERIFTKDDVDKIVKDEVLKSLRKIRMNLTVKQAETLNRGLEKLGWKDV